MLEYSQRLTRRVRNAMSVPGVSTGRSLHDHALAAERRRSGEPWHCRWRTGRLRHTQPRCTPISPGATGDYALDSYNIFAGGHALIDKVYAAGKTGRGQGPASQA